jgi:hypothetical protein
VDKHSNLRKITCANILNQKQYSFEQSWWRQFVMSNYPFAKVFNPEPGWYAGDFHVHTDTSHDAENSPAELAELAREEGLDFLALTDHNTIEGFSKIEENLDFLFIPGIEVTLAKGHFNVFGMEDWRSWMEGITVSQKALPLPGEYQSVSDLMQRIAQEGLVSSINHPLLHPWEWLFKKTGLEYVHCVELWNDLYWPDNEQANPKTVELWTDWLNAGDRVTAIGGSDYHYLPKPERGLPGERLGQPATYVYAEQLSAVSILEGIRRGRVYVSRGPQVAFQAASGGKTIMIGDDLGEQYGEIEFTASISNQPEAFHAQLVRNGAIIATEQFSGGERSIQFIYTIEPGSSNWFRLDVLDNSGQALAITNPVFANYRRNELPGNWDGAQ